MQYILTQQEFDALTPVKRLQERNEALEKAKEIILKTSGYLCPHSEEARNEMYAYCDDCPLSFLSIGHKNSNLLCQLEKYYSK